MKLYFSKIIYILLFAFLAACTPISKKNDISAKNGDLELINSNFYMYKGQKMRLGGRIVSVKNIGDITKIEIVGLPLNRSGYPYSDDTKGRFLATIPAFLDPAIYQVNRLITVAGVVIDHVDGMVGSTQIKQVVIDADSYRLWPEPAAYEKTNGFNAIGVNNGVGSGLGIGFGFGFPIRW